MCHHPPPTAIPELNRFWGVAGRQKGHLLQPETRVQGSGTLRLNLQTDSLRDHDLLTPIPPVSQTKDLLSPSPCLSKIGLWAFFTW